MTKWVKGKFESEIKSFTAIANKIASDISQQEIKKKLVEQMLEDFKKKYNAKKEQVLKPTTWRMLEGSESWNCDTMIKIEKQLKSSDIKLLYEIIYEMLSEKNINCPIIMMQNNIGMLVCGENTLMACKLLNIEPKVIMI
jgi:hypothetical protein